MTFLNFLAKFRSTMSNKSNFLDFHFREFTAAITPRLDCELVKITSNTQKYSLMEIIIIITMSAENYMNKTCGVSDLFFYTYCYYHC